MEMLVILRNGNPEKKNVTFIKLITINWVPSHWEKEIWSASQKGMCFYFSVIVAQNGTQEKKKKFQVALWNDPECQIHTKFILALK